MSSVPIAESVASASRRPVRPKLELNLAPTVQDTSSDTDDSDNMLLMLDKLRRAKHLIAESKERKRKREVITDAMNGFFRDSNITMQKYARICQDKKKEV